MKTIYCILTVFTVGLASIGHYRFTQCLNSTSIAVSLSELEDLAFECARTKCDRMEQITDMATQLRALFADKAEQCMGTPVHTMKYGQEI